MPATPCAQTKPDGTTCRAPAQASGRCFAHDPATAGAWKEAQDAGRTNRRQKEAAIAGFFDVAGLRTGEDLYRVLEVLLFESLNEPSSWRRDRMMLGLVREARQLNASAQAGEVIAALERVLSVRHGSPPLDDPLGDIGENDAKRHR